MDSYKEHVPSNARIKGLGSKACCDAGADRRLIGIVLSERLSTKSFAMKLVSEKVSKLKLGPRGNMDLPVGGAPAIGPEEAQKLQDPTSSCSALSIGQGFGITSDSEGSLVSWYLCLSSIVYRPWPGHETMRNPNLELSQPKTA